MQTCGPFLKPFHEHDSGAIPSQLLDRLLHLKSGYFGIHITKVFLVEMNLKSAWTLRQSLAHFQRIPGDWSLALAGSNGAT